MTVLKATPKFTSVTFKGLDNLNLPFTSHIIDSDVDDSALFQNLKIHEKDKYYVKSVTGLEPPGQTVAIARTASGGKYQGRESEDREIVVLIGLNPNWDKGETPALLRQNLYTMLSTGYNPKVRIFLNAGFPLCFVDAYITQFEASIFDKDPMVQLTLTALNPTFAATSQIAYLPSEMDEKHPNVYNYATAETGFKFAVKFTDDMNGWFIKQADNQSVGMIFDYAFSDGDVLTVSTVPGETYIHVKKHRGKVKNKMGILTNASEWITLHPGSNVFVVPKQTGKWSWTGKLTFTAQYWGL